jgi:predicted RecA/RadA family phage recombinase
MPLPVADQHPSGSILAVGGQLRLATLPPNTRVPLQSVVTTAAAVAVDATTATFTSTTPLLIDDDFDIPFGATTLTTIGYSWIVPTLTTTVAVVTLATSISVTAVAPYTLPAGARVLFGSVLVITTADTLIGTTATTVPTRPIPAAIPTTTASVGTVVIQRAKAAVATATGSTPFIATLSLAGIQSVSQPLKTNLIPIRSFKSGLGNEQRPTMIDFTAQISGWIDQRDQAYRRIVKGLGQKGLECWAEYYSPDGTFQRGAAFIADVGKEEKNDAVLTYSFTLGFQGIPTQGEF